MPREAMQILLMPPCVLVIDDDAVFELGFKLQEQYNRLLLSYVQCVLLFYFLSFE